MKLRTGWVFVLMICLVAFSVCYGAYRGWSQERARVEESYAGLESMLQTRVESAYNVLAVAKRHISGEEGQRLFRLVEQTRDVLEGSASLSEKAAANQSLTLYAKELLSHLAALDSVQADSRDKMYVESYLPQMLAQSEEKTVGAVYNQAASEFNSRIRGTFSGWIARNLLGIRLAEEFTAQ